MSDALKSIVDFDFGLGTWQWGDTMLWGYGQGYAADDVRAAFEASIRAGIQLYDTAEVYGMGRSESLLGQFQRGNPAPVYIATKFFPFPWRLTRRQLLNALRGSLKRLGVAQVDLYQVHWPTPLTPVEVWMEALADAVEEGLTREIGVSNYNLQLTERAAEALAKRGLRLASNQVEYSLLHRGIERDGLMDYCRAHQIRIIAYSPLAKGLLTGKYTPDNPPPGLRNVMGRGRLARLQPLTAQLKTIGDAHGGKTPAQVALNWAICKKTLPIPGAKNARQAEQNAGALGWRLTEAEVNLLDDVSRGV